MEILIIVCSILAMVSSVAALTIALYTLVEVKAFQRSTHKIEYMPVPVPDITKKQNKEFMEGFNPDMDNEFIMN